MRARGVLRVGLAFLGASQLAVGVWALLAPESFFGFRWVGMGMAYDVHLVADYGALSVATSVVLLVAAVTLTRTMARTALVTYLAFAVPHLVIHLRLLDHLEPAGRGPLVTALTVAVVLGVALVPLTAHARTDGEGQAERIASADRRG